MDHPRFERIQGHRDSLHLAYHGGKVVELVLWLVDRCVISRMRVSATARPPAYAAIPTNPPGKPPQGALCESSASRVCLEM